MPVRSSHALWIALLIFAGVARPADATPALQSLTYSGSQQALDDLDRDINAAGNDDAKLGALETRLLELLRRSDTSFAARQAICQRLGNVLAIASPKLNDTTLAMFSAMLTTERESELARLALEPVPGEAVDAAFLGALGTTSGRTRLGIIQSIGKRCLTAAVPRLAVLLDPSDAATSALAAHALGEIGNAEALAALRDAPESRRPILIAARLALARRLPAADANAIYEEVYDDVGASLHLRTIALRSSLDLYPVMASARIVEVLGGDEWAFKQVALESIAALPAGTIVPALAAKLETWDPPTQIGAIAALGRTGDPGAVSAVTAAVRHENVDVRSSAIMALGSLPGNHDIAHHLARIIASEKNSDIARLARQSLARLTGGDISKTVLAAAEHGETAIRIVFLEQLALRHMTEGVPLLLNCRNDSTAAVRTAAVGALGELGSVGEEAALLDWAVGATDPLEQQRALRAAVGVALRNPDATQRGRLIIDTIENATSDACVRLIPALQRIGGPAAAECAARLAIRENALVSDAAVSALGRWGDRAALAALATVAENSAVASTRLAALEAALGYLQRNRETWSAEMSQTMGQLLRATRDSDTRKQIVSFLARASDEHALGFVEPLQADSILGETARDAALAIRANRAGPVVTRASAGTGSMANIFDGKIATGWTVPANDADWIEIDFKLTRPFRQLTLDQSDRTGEFPERYEVFVTDDVNDTGLPLASGAGQSKRTIIDLPPGTRGRYVIIKNSAQGRQRLWTICELFVD